MQNQRFYNMSLDMIFNDETLNIFSDASMRSNHKSGLDACYGAIAVNKDVIIDQVLKLNSFCTVPAAELRGIRLGISLGYKYRNNYRVINLFSDSQVSIYNLRDYSARWVLNPVDNQYYSQKILPTRKVKNQSLNLECMALIENLKNTNIVNLFHQMGHVDSSIKDIKKAVENFAKYNRIQGTVDYNIGRYLSVYNNYIDGITRSNLNTANIYENEYRDPISFEPIPIKPIYQNKGEY